MRIIRESEDRSNLRELQGNRAQTAWRAIRA